MAAPAKYRRRHLSDMDPIVFPEPVGAPRPDAYPPDFDSSSDLIVDPYGNFFCFVCQVQVPKGSSNLSQHLTGKRHDTNNKRFATQHQKQAVRARYVTAAQEQRDALPVQPTVPVPPTLPIVPTPRPDQPVGPPVASAHSPGPAAPVTAIPSVPAATAASPAAAAAPSVSPESKKPKLKKRAMEKRELGKKYERFSIDKAAFLSSVLGSLDRDDDESGDDPDNALAEGDPVAASAPVAVDFEERQRPFGPLKFKAPEGPDLFFDSMAAESEPTETAASIRKILTSSAAAKGAERAGIGSAEDDVIDVDADVIKPVSPKAEGKLEELGDYIRLTDESARQAEEREEEAEREKARLLARESMLILKDTNGEELPPWLLDAEATQNVLYSSDSSVALHFEIMQFSNFVSPTEAELSSRNEMVLMVETIVKRLWPSSTTQVFGSYATGLYLPSSDIDICVMGTPAGGALKEFEQLADAIRNVSGFARRVNVLPSAKVPLVKIISRKTSMNCDICIGHDNGPKNVPVIKKYLDDYPALRPLLLVVKCFLKQRDLNEVFSGGLGSYSVFLLVVSHLQMLKYNFPTSKANLGAVLQTFFQFYGRMFNLCIAGIRIKDNGCYFDKFEKYETPPHETMRFSIEDPNDETNELGKNGYAATRVRRAFSNASMTLINWRRDDGEAAPTPLGSILQYDDLLQLRRTNIIEVMEKKGLKPLRECISEAEGEFAKAGGPSRASRSLEAGEEDRNQSPGKRTSDVTGPKRAYSPALHRERDPRERDPRDRDPRDRDPRDRDPRDRDPRDRDPRDRDPRERDPRERDPRLAKRRRANMNQESERPRAGGNSGNYYSPGNSNHARSQMQAAQSNHVNQDNHIMANKVNQNMTNSAYQNVPDHGNYDPGMVYPGQPNFPVQQFPATPGYQYVDHQASFSSNGAVAQPMYANPGYFPQQAVPQQGPNDGPNSYSHNQMYGGPSRQSRVKKRGGFYPRRGGYRGR